MSLSFQHCPSMTHPAQPLLVEPTDVLESWFSLVTRPSGAGVESVGLGSSDEKVSLGACVLVLLPASLVVGKSEVDVGSSTTSASETATVLRLVITFPSIVDEGWSL